MRHLDALEPDETGLDRHGLRGTRFLLAVGSANPTKNLASLVRAYSLLPTELGVRLVIVGGRSPRVFAAAAESIDPPGVVRTGSLAGDAPLKALYRAATALVFPSIYEGFGIPPLEAMRCGCSVLAARAAALPEVCGDGVMYFDAGDVEAMAQAMRAVCSDDALRFSLRKTGAAQARHFLWPAAALTQRSTLKAAL